VGVFERERIVEIQRARILAAMTQVVCERGAGNMSVADVVMRAGVSRRTFYEMFADCDECFLAALDQALSYAGARVASVYEARASWRERLRVSLAELLSLFDEQSQLARLLMVESLGGGPGARARRARTLERLVAAVDGGRDEHGAKAGLTRLTAEGVVGAVLSVIHTRVAAGEQGGLSGLLNELMCIVVLPYLGGAQARRELERPLPPPAPVRDGEPLRSDPFKDAGMRLTYRTMLVLGAIAASPGASNRRIGEAAGIGDQGQVSKLLSRLERLGLIANSGQGHSTGEPNEWSLTTAGRQVEQSIHAYTGAPTNEKQA
jgi:AcrR family transcriptional regulator/DNA-binding MarR family transcriptional regulator